MCFFVDVDGGKQEREERDLVTDRAIKLGRSSVPGFQSRRRGRLMIIVILQNSSYLSSLHVIDGEINLGGPCKSVYIKCICIPVFRSGSRSGQKITVLHRGGLVK